VGRREGTTGEGVTNRMRNIGRAYLAGTHLRLEKRWEKIGRIIVSFGRKTIKKKKRECFNGRKNSRGGGAFCGGSPTVRSEWTADRSNGLPRGKYRKRPRCKERRISGRGSWELGGGGSGRGGEKPISGQPLGLKKVRSPLKVVVRGQNVNMTVGTDLYKLTKETQAAEAWRK